VREGALSPTASALNIDPTRRVQGYWSSRMLVLVADRSAAHRLLRSLRQPDHQQPAHRGRGEPASNPAAGRPAAPPSGRRANLYPGVSERLHGLYELDVRVLVGGYTDSRVGCQGDREGHQGPRELELELALNDEQYSGAGVLASLEIQPFLLLLLTELPRGCFSRTQA
jgi:hypothetical protein